MATLRQPSNTRKQLCSFAASSRKVLTLTKMPTRLFVSNFNS